MKHVTEEQIQEFVDGTLADETVELRQHLSACEDCRAQVAAYRVLSAQLADDAGFELSPNFAAKVMEHVAPVPPERSNVPLIAAIAAAAVVVFGAAMIFLDLGFLRSPLNELQTWIMSIGATIVAVPAALNVNPVLFGLAVLVILTLTLVERLAVATRRGHNVIAV